jgi:hypothetical protein
MTKRLIHILIEFSSVQKNRRIFIRKEEAEKTIAGYFALSNVRFICSEKRKY